MSAIAEGRDTYTVRIKKMRLRVPRRLAPEQCSIEVRDGHTGVGMEGSQRPVVVGKS